MRLMEEIKEYTDEIVLVDTNIIINLEQRKCSPIDLKAICKIFDGDIKPFLTDLSYCELIIGCRDIKDFQFHSKELNEMGFMLCGMNEPLCNYLSNLDYDSIKTNKELNHLKKTIAKLRNDVIFPMFSSLFRLYCKVCIMAFHEEDKNYWDNAFFIFNEIFQNKVKELNDLLLDCYEKFIDVKKESKRLIKDVFTELLINLLVYTKPDKYEEDEVSLRIDQALIASNFTNLVKRWGIKSNKEDSEWLSKGFIVKTRKIVDMNDEFPIISDGICFLLSQIIFNNANYNSHDFIDLFNIYFASKQEIKMHYYSNDKKKWNRFIEIEKALRPNLKFYFNA